jgi:sirohydrochlorin ferrochelatase
MRGLLLIDHGSRRPEANAQVEDLARRVAALQPQDLVAVAHLELAQPDIAAGVAVLVERGATEIIGLPYFLGEGRHAQEDVPRMLAAACTTQAVPWRCGAALGPHNLLARLLLERANVS